MDVYPTNTPQKEYGPSDLNQLGATCGMKQDGRNYDYPLNYYGYVRVIFVILIDETHTSNDAQFISSLCILYTLRIIVIRCHLSFKTATGPKMKYS